MTTPAFRFSLDAAARQLHVNGTLVSVGARAFDVLSNLASNEDRVVTKQELLETVWGGLAVEEGNLSV
ncbi:MAG: DNA-binding winged helix-turn-helix (wHTH) protein [Yoonia sp.]|jgi:DNA-binding winged helix-turn-helix (wHTH) protein